MVKRIILALVLAGSGSTALAQWKYGETVDAMSDEKRARSFVSNEAGSVGLKCDAPGADSLYIQFTSARYLGGRGGSPASRELLYRFDSDQPVKLNWSHDGRTAILTNSTEVWNFLRRLETAQKLSLRASTYDYNVIDVTFDVPGASAEIAKVAGTCSANRR